MMELLGERWSDDAGVVRRPSVTRNATLTVTVSVTFRLRRARVTAALAALMVLSGQVWAAEAVCRDYLAATGEDRALFDGFIYGFVSAKSEGRGPNTINAATRRVREMTRAYCAQKPDDRVQAVVRVFADTVAKYGLDPIKP